MSLMLVGTASAADGSPRRFTFTFIAGLSELEPEEQASALGAVGESMLAKLELAGGEVAEMDWEVTHK